MDTDMNASINFNNQHVTQKELKLLFQAGTLKNACIYREGLTAEWKLWFEANNQIYYYFKAQRGHDRTYKTLDAAFNDAYKIGFANAGVVSHRQQSRIEK